LGLFMHLRSCGCPISDTTLALFICVISPCHRPVARQCRVVRQRLHAQRLSEVDPDAFTSIILILPGRLPHGLQSQSIITSPAPGPLPPSVASAALPTSSSRSYDPELASTPNSSSPQFTRPGTAGPVAPSTRPQSVSSQHLDMSPAPTQANQAHAAQQLPVPHRSPSPPAFREWQSLPDGLDMASSEPRASGPDHPQQIDEDAETQLSVHPPSPYYNRVLGAKRRFPDQ